MTLFHAVVWIDHQSAQVLQFDAEHVQASKVKAHSHHTPQHGSEVRTQHEFFWRAVRRAGQHPRGAGGGPAHRPGRL